MTARMILQSFDTYRLARINFVNSVADLALRQQNIDILLSAGVLDLLKPLLDDVCVQVQQCAAVALGRIVHHAGSHIGLKVYNDGLLKVLLGDLHRKNKHFKRAAMFALRSVCRHGAEITNVLVEPANGTMDALMMCLADLDPLVKEAAAWACGYIARNSHSLARLVVEAGVVPHLVLCLQEPELSVRRVGASALADIARYSPELAITILNANAIGHLARALNDRDDTLKRQALLALACVARQGNEAAESCIQAEIFPDVLVFLSHQCPLVRRNAALVVRDVVRHTPELAQYVINMSGISALVDTIKTDPYACKENVTEKEKMLTDENDHRSAAVAALGYMAGHGAQFAHYIVGCDGVQALYDNLISSNIKSELKSVCAWCFGQIGRHCPEQVAATGALPVLMEMLMHPNISEELRVRCNTALRVCIHGCTTLAALEPLMQQSPPDIMKYVLGQLTKILPNDPRARRLFVSCGGLKRLQEIEAEPGSTMMEYITMINACFPDEIVRFYTPGYPDLLLDKIEQYKPTINDDTSSLRVTIAADEEGPMPSRTVSRELDMIFDD